MLKTLIIFLFFASYSHQVISRVPSSHLGHRTWEEYIQTVLDKNTTFPDAEYLLSWREDTEVVFDKNPPMPSEINEVTLQCQEKKLWPTHPQQSSKSYLYATYAHYDHTRLTPNAYACQIPNPTKRFCVKATYAKVIVMSDTFEDSCGNTYRGYWLVTFLKSDESMGTLLSKGRTVYEKPNSQFKNEFETGNTYELNVGDFLFLSRPNGDDLMRIKNQKEAAFKEGYRLINRIFIPKGQ